MASEVSKVEITPQQQQQQRQRHGKGRSSSSSSTSVRDGTAAANAGEVMPEWKLKCLCAEVGVPRITSGGLNMGGCF